jgi:predicted Ser/Thr protein kinase
VEGYATLRAWFDRLRDLGPAARDALWPDVPTELRGDLLALLTAHDRPSPLDAERPLADELPPERLGRYRVLWELGRGGMGVVYLAEQDEPRRPVALKTLRLGHRDPASRERFRREAQAMADLAHPSVPHVYEVFDVDGEPIVAMERVEGERLDVAAAGWSAEVRLDVLARLAEAVGALHARGVVHRDLKPANVLVRRDVAGRPEPVVVDFGIARAGDVAGPERAGTEAYAAPEQRRGAPAEPTADVYALGRVAEVLWPANGADRPRGLDAVIRRATAEDPASRPADGAAFAADLRRLQRRRSGWVAPAAVAVVAAGLVAVVVGNGGDGAAERRFEAWVAAEGADPTGSEVAAFAADGAGTRAASWAWARLAATSSGPEAASARVAAYVEAVHPDDAEAALTAIALDLRAAQRWGALGRVLDALPATALPEARAMARLAGWDVAGAAPYLSARQRGLLAPFERVVPLGPAQGGAPTSDGRWVAMVPEGVEVRDGDGRVLAAFPLALPGVAAWPAGDTTLVFSGDPRGALQRLGPDGLTPTGFPDPVGVGDVRVADIDGDGVSEVYAALAHPERGVVVASPWTAAPRPLHAGFQAAWLESSLAVADLDGDGRSEVIVAGRGPRGEVRVLTGAPDAATARGRLGVDAHEVAAWPDGSGGHRVVVAVDHPDWTGQILTLAWDGAALDVESVVESPVPVHRLNVADLDGDGVSDLLGSAFTEHGERALVLFAGHPDGTLSDAVWIPGLHVVYSGPEGLWVGDAARSFRVGVDGGGPLPARVLDAEPPFELDGAASLDPTRRARLDTLAGFGLAEEVGRAWIGVGSTPGRRDDAAIARGLARLGDDEAFDVAREQTSQVRSPDARAALADVVGARLDADALIALGPDVGRWAPIRAAWLARGVDVDFTTPLSPSWSFPTPGVARRLPLDGALELAFTMDRGDLAVLPIDWDGGPLDVTVDLDVVELDWAGGVEIAVEAGPFAEGALLWRSGGGDRTQHRHHVWCGPGLPVPAGDLVGPRRISFTYADGRASCGLGADRAPARAVGTAPAGPARLVIRADHVRDGARSGGRVRLRRVSIRGATVADTPGDPLGVGLAEGSADAVAAASSRGALAAAVAAARTDAAAAAHLDALSEADAAFLLRASPERWLAAAAERPASLATRVRDAWGVALDVADPWADPVASSPALRALDPDDPVATPILVERVRALVAAGEVIPAERVLERLRATSTPDAWWWTARLRARQGDVEGARAAVAEWLRRVPDPDVALDALAGQEELRELAPAGPARPRYAPTGSGP